jgi:2,3-bisphosphoglycerate-independent phosphoglycerate mutase
MPSGVLLVVMDGWGVSERKDANAIALARIPVFNGLMKKYPNATLGASGEDVGLPDGQMGNSEVGHLNLGAGRVVYQEYTRINRSIRNGEFQRNPVILDAMRAAGSDGRAIHLFGLVSDGGVHSHQEHLYALVRMAKGLGLSRIFVHAFMDGRDTPPKSGAGYLASLEAELSSIGAGKVATVSGRYYAMDRDNRWDRVEKAWRALVEGEGRKCLSSSDAMKAAYGAGETDEFVVPTVITEAGRPVGSVRDGDSVLVFNFRPDRMRELTSAFTRDGFSGFKRGGTPRLGAYACMTQYDEKLNLPVAFPPHNLDNLLAQVLSGRNLSQLRIAETEKYAHVTYFFNGGEEKVYPGEDRILIPSPKEVATYDLKPQMSAPEVTETLLRRISQGNHDFILVNYANADMVGHTGILKAAISAVETVDECLGRILSAATARGYRTLVTADHGNAEQMIDYKTGQPHTAHTCNPVPVILVDDSRTGGRLRKGMLADVAPTVLDLMGIPKPAEMEGSTLLV